MDTEELVIEGVGLMVMILITIVGIAVLYKLIVKLKKRYECHHYNVKNCPSINGPHIDVAISNKDESRIVALRTLPYPASYYNPYSEVVRVGTQKLEKEIVLTIDPCSPITDYLGGSTDVHGWYNINDGSIPLESFTAFITVRN